MIDPNAATRTIMPFSGSNYAATRSQGIDYEKAKQLYLDKEKTGQGSVDPNGLAVWAIKNGYTPSFGDTWAINKGLNEQQQGGYTGWVAPTAQEQQNINNFYQGLNQTDALAAPQNAPIREGGAKAQSSKDSEIARAQQVWANADKLAGTGKYVGKTADQIRTDAHAYAESLRAGGPIGSTQPTRSIQPVGQEQGQPLQPTGTTPGITKAPVMPAMLTNASEIDRSKWVWNNADALAGTGKYTGKTADQIRESAHAYAESLRGGGPILSETTGQPATQTPATPPNPQQEIEQINNQANSEQDTELNTILNETKSKDLSGSAKLIDELTKTLSEKTPSEATPSLLQTFKNQQAELGVGPLEDSLNAKNLELDQLDANYKALHATEENRLVPMATIRKRQSAEDIQYQQDKANLQAEINSVTNKLNQKYSVLEMMTKFSGQDVQNAQKTYQDRIDNITNLTKLLGAQESDEKSAASANLTVIQNLLKDGSIDYSNLSTSQKANISNLELQSGFPLGATQFLHENVKDPIVAHLPAITQADGTVIIPIMTTKNDGTYSIVNFNTGVREKVTGSGGGGGSSATTKNLNNFQRVNDMKDQLLTYVKASYATNPTRSFGSNANKLTHEEYLQFEEAFIADGGTAKEFEENFSEYDSGE